MHNWADNNVDWAGINEAAAYIGLGLRRWGRIGVRDYKEKFGTVRVYCDLGWWQFHSITHPGYAWSRYPDWLWKLDCDWGTRIIRPFSWLILPYHRWLYRRYYSSAVKCWPHLREEILSCADHPELLKGV